MNTKNSILFWLVCACLFTGILQSAWAEDNDLLKLLPRNTDITGWIREGEAIMAEDEESLSALLKDDAPLYREHNVTDVVFQNYRRNDVTLTLELYQMKTGEQAKLVYIKSKIGEPDALDKIGNEGRSVIGADENPRLEFWQKTLFVRLTIDGHAQNPKNDLVQFAKTVSNNIKTGQASPCQNSTGYPIGVNQPIGSGFSNLLPSGECETTP